MQVPRYALALAPAKVATSTQLPGRENSRTAETNKNFPRAPTCLHWLASQPTRRALSVDAAFADPSKTDSILAVAAIVSHQLTYVAACVVQGLLMLTAFLLLLFCIHNKDAFIGAASLNANQSS
jgi:hypothetical protein